jgi:hypothetical protein
MIFTITMSFEKLSDKRLAAYLGSRKERLVAELSEEMNRQMLAVLRRVQQKLSGEVLQTRTGSLLRSARVEPLQVTVDKIVGRVTAGGSAASPYAEVQELGGRAPYDILPKRKQALAFFPSAVVAQVGRRMLNRFRVPLGARRGELKPEKYAHFGKLGGIVVKRVTHPPLPARSFMRSVVNEMTDEIVARLNAAFHQALTS